MLDHKIVAWPIKVLQCPGAITRPMCQRQAEAGLAVGDAQRGDKPQFDLAGFTGLEIAKAGAQHARLGRSEEQTSELPSIMRNPTAVFCLKKKTKYINH